MPRFFFHIRNGSECVEDETGVELANLAAARKKGVEGLRGVLAADILEGVLSTQEFLIIENANREHVLTIVFDDVVRPDHGTFVRTGGTLGLQEAITLGNDD